MHIRSQEHMPSTPKVNPPTNKHVLLDNSIGNRRQACVLLRLQKTSVWEILKAADFTRYLHQHMRRSLNLCFQTISRSQSLVKLLQNRPSLLLLTLSSSFDRSSFFLQGFVSLSLGLVALLDCLVSKSFEPIERRLEIRFQTLGGFSSFLLAIELLD